MTFQRSLILALLLICGAACSQPPQDSQTNADSVPKTLTIYSARHYDSDRAMYAAYEQETGVKVRVREAGADQLLETMKAEGARSPADLIIASDAGALWRFKDADLTQPVDDAEINQLVPAHFRQADGNWIGLAKRIRVVAYDPTRFDADDVDTWVKLEGGDKADEICVRSSSNIYNLSLLSELIARLGEEGAGEWAKRVRANMARAPQGGDTDQIRAVAAGQCGIAIVNHYYWVRLATSNSASDRRATDATRLIVPSFADGRGAHVNVTGIAVTASSQEPELATDFIKFLLTEHGQELLTTETKEFPIIASAPLPEGVDMVPEFEASALSLDVLGENQAEAQRLYDLAGWN